MKCTYCNNDNIQGAVFCAVCGKKLQEDKKQPGRFCAACGNPLKENAVFCASCGTKAEPKASRPVVTIKTAGKDKKKIIIGIVAALLIAVTYIIVCLLMGAGEMDISQQKEIIEKLQKFTDVREENNKYLFEYGEEDFYEEWCLTYAEENEFVTIRDAFVVSCFEEWFGEGCFAASSASEGGFSYDLDENAARIYFDCETEDGTLSIVEYDMDKDKFTVILDDRRYSAGDEFQERLDEYVIADILKEDVESFKADLQENGLSIDQLLGIQYETLAANSELFIQGGQKEWENAEDMEESPEDIEEYLETDNINWEDVDFDIPAATPSEFYGSWYDTYTGRCYMEIISVNDAYFDIRIDWEVTIRENAHWEFSGEYDADKGGIVYKDGIYREEYYPEDGGDVEETVVYNNGEGLIYLKDGALYWEVWVPENIENEFVFQHADEEESGLFDYILPYSDSIRLTDEDIQYLSLQELNYARNEIYARHGRIFQSQELQDYFHSKSWYYGYIEASDFDEDSLSQIEKDNIRLLEEAELSIDSNGYQLD